MNITKYILLYTLIFAALFCGCFGVYFWTQNLSFFDKIDGFEQHYTAFVYIGRWISDICRNVFIEHNFALPMWNHGIGYGADIPTTLIAYVFDPFNYLAAVFPEKWSEYVFDGIIVFKFYLSGLAYSCFAFYRQQKWPYVLAGALIYTFCGTMYIGFIQMYFINPMYLFPLLIIGFDRLWRDNRFGMYTLVLAWCFLNHFYFAYMMCIFLLVYGILRFTEDVLQTHAWQPNILKLLKIGGYSVLAFGIAAVALLPMADNLLQQGRMDIKYYLPLWYHSGYYGQLLLSFIRPAWMWNRDCIIGFGAIALPCLYIFFKNRGNLRLKIEFILLTLCLTVPFLGYILNGFSYPANRWIWAYCLVVAYIVTLALPMFNPKAVKSSLWFVLIYIALACFYTLDFTKSFLFLIVETCIFGLCLYACYCNEKPARFIQILAVILSVIASAHTYFSADEDALGKKNMPAATAYQTLTRDSGLPILQQVMFGDVRRYNQIKLSEHGNASWIYKLSGTNFYMSIYNDNIDRFHRAIALLTPPWVTQYYDLNRRAELAALLGVEYFITDNENKYLLPFGYDNMQQKEGYIVARPSFQTSLIYGFDRAVSLDKFMQLSPYERQQLLLQAVVLDDPKAQAELNDFSLQTDDAEYVWPSELEFNRQTRKVYVSSDNQLINLLFNPVSNAEIYAYFKGLDYKDNTQIYYVGLAGYDHEIVHPELQAMLRAATYQSHVYGNKHDWLINLGYTAADISKIRVFFNKSGQYDLQDLKIYARRKQDILQNISQLRPLGENIQMTDNALAFDVALDKPQYVFISVPYSEGWRAYSNNAEVPVLQANVAFMSLLLPQGVHHIQLRYETPYLRLGALISLLSLILLSGIICLKRRKNKQTV